MEPSAEAIMAGSTSGMDAGGAAASPSSFGSNLWNSLKTAKGYLDDPDAQTLLKTGLSSAGKKQSPMSPMNMQGGPLQATTPQPDVDRLAWLRAFNVQG
jgi:hypothetical protein